MNPKDYAYLRDSIIAARRPQSLMDKIDAFDLLTNLWEELRFRRGLAATIRAGGLVAAQKLAADLRFGKASQSPSDKPAEMARNYFSKDSQKRNIARKEFEEVGLSVAEVHATSAQVNGRAMEMFEKMIRSRVSNRRKLQKAERTKRSSGILNNQDAPQW